MSTQPVYFGGHGADLGTVRQLAATSFGAFVKECLGHPVLVNITRSQYHSLTKRERDAHKRVPYFTPARFKGTPSRRVYEEATTCDLIAIDIDDKDQALPFFARPALIAEQLHPLAFAAYTTASSTPEHPRLRIVVAAEGIGLNDYPAAVRYVGVHLLGMKEVNSESKVAVQPMYLPTLYREDDPVESHPLIIAVPEGAAVTAGVVSGTVVPSGLSPAAPTGPADLQSLDHVRPQVEGITIADIESALEHLNPDESYMGWIAVAAALKHQWPREPESELAFQLFDEWSSQGDKYVNTEETRGKWDSFKFSPKGRVPITLRTILKKAMDAGWSQHEEVARRCYEEVLNWIVNPDRKPSELLDQGIPRIVSTPLLSTIQRDVLLSKLQDRCAAARMKVSRSALKSTMARLERQQAKAGNEGSPTATPDSLMPPWARGICYVAGQDEFYQHATGRRFKPNVLDTFYSVQLMTGADTESGKPAIAPRDYLTNIMKCPRVDDYRYDPSQPQTAFLLDGKKRSVNTYVPTYPQPSPVDADEAGSILMEHVNNLIAEPEYVHLLMSFLAYHVQAPGAKIRWAVLLQGAEGCGKTVLAEALRAALGREHVRSIGAELLFTDFNGWATGSQLVAVEEVRVVGHNRYEVMNKLKPCITNDYVTINEKRDKPYMTPNVSNYLMFTNFHDALAVSNNDRRYFVLNSKLQNKAQVLALGGADYFARLYDMIRGKPAALRAWFEAYELSPDFNPQGHAPFTKYMSELQSASASPLASAVADAISDKKHALIRDDLISTKCLKDLIDATSLPAFTDQALGSVLREMDYVNTGRVTIEEQRHYLWVKRGAKIADPRAEALIRLGGKTSQVTGFEALQ